MIRPAYQEFIMAVERVERRLRKVTAALDEAGIPYAVIGGNAVAAWVSRADPSATRTTKDVDLLVRRSDLSRIVSVMNDLGFHQEDLRGLIMFIDPDEPSRRSGVHLIWADERVRPSYVSPAPSIKEVERDPQGFAVLNLAALVRMKLTSLRDIDRVHVRDLLEVGLIDDSIRNSLSNELRERLADIEANSER